MKQIHPNHRPAFIFEPNSYIALRKMPANGPRPFQRLHRFLKGYTPWQIIIGALTTVYAAHHADLLLGLTPAEEEKKMVNIHFVNARSPVNNPSVRSTSTHTH